MKQTRTVRIFFAIIFFTILATLIALPKEWPIQLQFASRQLAFTIRRPELKFNFLGKEVSRDFELKQGLDIQGGMQVVLKADMSKIDSANRSTALESAKDVIQRRVDLFGVSEPVIQTSRVGTEDRIIV